MNRRGWLGATLASVLGAVAAVVAKPISANVMKPWIINDSITAYNSGNTRTAVYAWNGKDAPMGRLVFKGYAEEMDAIFPPEVEWS